MVTWAGTRGVMPLTAALSVPLTADDGSILAGRPLILVLTTSVVVFTLVVQGLTLAAVVNRSGLSLEPEHTAREENDARDALNRAALDHVDHLATLEVMPDTAVDRVRRGLAARLDHTPETPEGTTAGAAYRQLRHEVIAVQSTELHCLYDEHRISDTTRRRLQHDLDREEAALGTR
ncbi:Na+/H+ antiporter OS=Kitasatospora aureofaciens OX=1894 GN=GCM10010502_24880 PE=3 SV=1 [Kitasatospora aureofaciens]